MVLKMHLLRFYKIRRLLIKANQASHISETLEPIKVLSMS